MPIIEFFTSGHEKVLNAVQAQESAFGKLAKEIKACGGDTSKIDGTFKAFVLTQGKVAESTLGGARAFGTKAKTIKESLDAIGKYRQEEARLEKKHQETKNSVQKLYEEYSRLKTAVRSGGEEATKNTARLNEARTSLRNMYGELRENRLEMDRLSKTGLALAQSTRSIDESMRWVDRTFAQTQTRAQKLGQDWRRLGILLKELKLNPTANAEQIKHVERAMKLVRQELIEMTTGFKRMSEEARAGMQIVNNAVEKALTPLQRYQRDLRLVNQLYKNGKIDADRYRIAKNQLWNDYQRGVAAGNKELGAMAKVLPGVVNHAKQIAGAFGVFLSVAGSIQMARQELEKLKEIRLEMHGENVSLARLLTHVSEVIVHEDPEFVKRAKYKPVDMARELKLNPKTIAKVFRAAVAASPHALMEDKIKEAEEITRAAIIYYPFTPDAEKAEELALGAQNVLKWAQAHRGQAGVPKIETAEEAVGLIQAFATATQVTDPKKIAEYIPRIIGGLTPYGDSMAFSAALFGEGTHLMTDSTGAPIVGFSARIGKFLYDFSKKTDKKTGQYLRPEMADLKTTEERLEYMHNIAMMRPQEVQGELMNYLNGITPEQEKEILKELKMDNNEVEAIMNMTEDQLKNLVGMPEEFIKEMRGRGLAIHWGAMVYFMTNKDAVERFRARLKDMKRKSQNPGQYYTSDIQARKNDELYKSAMLDEEIESAKMLSSMEYTDAGRFEKLRDHIFNNMMHRVGTPTLERYMQQYMTSWGATKDWLRLFESVESAMVETAKNTKALTADERMVAINAMMEMMRMIEDYMPNDLRKQVDSGGSRANALHSFFSSINNSNFSPSLKRGISGAVGRNVWQNDPTFTADVLKSHIGKTFSWEEVIIFAESALAESERYANYGTTINPSSPNYTTFSINYWKDKEKEDKKRLETFKRMKNEADRVAPQPQAQPAAQQPGLFNIPDPVAAEQEHREKAMVPWQNRLLENLSNPNYSVLAQMGGPGSKPLQKNAFVERQKQALQEREAQRQRFMDRQEASRMLNRHQPSFDQLRDMTKEERKQVVENRKKREAAFEEERSMARIDRNADKAKREYDNAVKRYRKTPEYEELSPEQKAFVDGKIKQSYSGAWSGGYGYHPQIKDNSLATEQLHNSWGEYQDKLREGREEMKEIRKQSGASDSPRNPETIAREIQAIEQARAARHKAEEDGILQTGGSRADLYKWHPGKGNAVTFDRLGRAKVVNQDEEDDKKIAQLKNEQQKAEFDERKRQADESRDKYEQMIQGWREERNAQLAERRSELVRNSRRSFEMEHRRKNPLPDGIFIPGEQKRIRDQQSNEEQPKPDDGLKNALLKIDKTLEQVAQLAPILTAFQSIVPAIKQIQDNQNEYARIVATNSATLGGHPAV